MRHVDFSPLYRSTIGFDRLAQLLDSVGGVETEVTYPPYNIERLGENRYRISMALAGFVEDELKIEVKEQTLTVKGEKKPDAAERHFLHRGIAAMKDGLLDIDLVRNVPERLKPRSIPIGTGAPVAGQIEGTLVSS
jgi:molecular chaperone IbpA